MFGGAPCVGIRESVVAGPAPQGATPGWETGIGRKFLSLAVARIAAQILSLVWFVLAVRMLGAYEFGLVATGLAFLAIFAGLGDLGTSRGVVRYAAADERTMWSAYTRALRIRIPAGLALGCGVALIVAASPVAIPAMVVLLAGLTATAAGITELGYAAMRAVGYAGVEAALLVIERSLFLAVVWAALLLGAHALLVLGVYLLVNVVSALVTTVAVRHLQPVAKADAGPMFDTEGRYTAAGFSLVTVVPRIPSILVAVLAGTTAAGFFMVAQRPVEAVTLLMLAMSAPVFPMIRHRIASGREADAERDAVIVMGGLLAMLAPVVAGFLVVPREILETFFGAEAGASSGRVLQLLSVTILMWAARGVGEFVLLAEERARDVFVMTGTGVVLSIAAGIPLVYLYAEMGAATAVIISEVAMTAILLDRVPALRAPAAARSLGSALLLLCATAAALAPVRSSALAIAAVLGTSVLVGACMTFRSLRVLDRVL